MKPREGQKISFTYGKHAYVVGASLDIGPEGTELLSLWRDKGSPFLPLNVH